MNGLKDYRKLAGFSTQEQLAVRIGVPRPNITKWETGATKPTIDNIPKLAAALNVTEGEIIAAITAAKQESA